MDSQPNLIVRAFRDHPIGWAVAFLVFTVFPTALAVWHDLDSHNSMIRWLMEAVNAVVPDGLAPSIGPLDLLWFTIPVGLVMVAYLIYLVRTQPAVGTEPIDTRQQPVEEVESPKDSEANDQVEVGLFDLFDQAETSFSEVERLTGRIVDATTDFNVRLQRHTEELNELDAEGRELVTKARKIVSKAADGVNEYANEVDKFAEPLGTHIEKALDCWSRAATIWDEDLAGEIDDIIDAREEAVELKCSLATAEEVVRELVETIESWPRISKELIHAKAKASSVLGKLQARLSDGHSKARNIVSQFDEIIKRHGS